MMFAIRLKKMIDDSGLMQKEIAERAQVSAWSISQFVNGHGVPKRDTVERLAAALDCNVEYLMGTSNVVRYAKEEKITPKNAEGYSDPTAYKALKGIEREEKMEFKRGEIYEYELTNGQGTKYALVVSSDERSTDRVVSVVILNEKAYGNNAASVVAHSLMYADCNRVTFAVADRIGSYVRTATAEEMREIDRALINALGIDRIEMPKPGGIEEELNRIIDEQKRQLDNMTWNCTTQEARANKCEERILELTEENEGLKKNAFIGEKADTMTLRIERDFFKAQYEALLAKILERAV